jgi:prepilin-type N-terminal cleavage/methylation domain-containing protein
MKGFTLIELIIIIAIVAIVAIVAITVYNGLNGEGYTCRSGYQFAYNGHQIIGQNGGGVPCK